MTTTMKEQAPSLATRRVGARLQRWRKEAGKTKEDAALALMCHHTKVWRIETGRTLAKPGDIRELAVVYGIPDPERDELLRLARSANKPGVLDGYRDVVSGQLSLLADLEAVASEVQAYEVEWVWAGVQSPEYSWAILGLIDLPDDVRRRRLAFRQARQKVLRESGAEVHVVISEAALRYEVGGPDVMRGQVQHLVDLASAGLDVRVRPFRAGAHRWMAGGPFTILGFPDPADPAVVYTESHLDSRYMEKSSEVAEYRAIFGDLRAQAIPVKEFV